MIFDFCFDDSEVISGLVVWRFEDDDEYMNILDGYIKKDYDHNKKILNYGSINILGWYFDDCGWTY